MALHALDVNLTYQPNIDWQKANDHNTIAICKTSEGVGVSWDKSKVRRTAVRAARMLWAPYHFARPSSQATDPVDEAKFAIQAARDAGWNLTVDLPLVLDCEVTTLSAKATLDWCDRFCTEVKRRTGRGCWLYTGAWFWADKLHLRRAPKYGNVLWLSAYVPRRSLRVYLAKMLGYRPYLWQYTDAYVGPGTNGPVDRSVALVSDAQFKALIHA